MDGVQNAVIPKKVVPIAPNVTSQFPFTTDDNDNMAETPTCEVETTLLTFNGGS
jgi:hypothetical protein